MKQLFNTSVAIIVSLVFIFLAFGSSDSESDKKANVKEQEMLNNGWKKNHRGTSTKYCSTHSTTYNPNNAYGGCPKCFDKSWKDELNKPGGFRDRVSRP